MPIAPWPDTRWQILPHWLPVHVTLYGDVQRVDVPPYLVLMPTPPQAQRSRVIRDPGGTLTPEAVLPAVGPHVTVVIVRTSPGGPDARDN
jgi:hypothetical protein